MAKHVSIAQLRALRNQIPIQDVIRYLGQPCKEREGHFRFLCPLCQEFHTDVNPNANLGRCFRCERNFNAIDLAMIIERVPFLDAVASLRSLLEYLVPTPSPEEEPPW